MFCRHCGQKIPDDASLCLKCGKSQQATVSEDEVKWETCEIYYGRKTNAVVWETGCFWAEAIGPDGVYIAGKSSELTEYGGPTSDNQRVLRTHRALVSYLVKDGWEPSGDRGEAWFQQRFKRRIRADRKNWEECVISFEQLPTKLFKHTQGRFVAKLRDPANPTVMGDVISESASFGAEFWLYDSQSTNVRTARSAFHSLVEHLHQQGWEDKDILGGNWWNQRLTRRSR